MVKIHLRILGIAAALSAAAVLPAAAQGVTAPGTVIDSINWSQLSNDYVTFFNSPQTVMTADGVSVSVSSTGGRFIRFNEGESYTGNFANGTPLLAVSPGGGSDDQDAGLRGAMII